MQPMGWALWATQQEQQLPLVGVGDTVLMRLAVSATSRLVGAIDSLIRP
jgi:hypothetical protein